MKRGDVFLARFPHPAGGRGKKRPVVVVQADSYCQTLRSVVVAEITKNAVYAGDPACLAIEAATPDGKLAGIVQDSVVSCLKLATISSERMDQQIGEQSDAFKQQLGECLKAALAIA